MSIIEKFVSWLDPKLEKYRPAQSAPEPPVPESLPELLDLLKRTPKSVLSTHERSVIAAVMGFSSCPVSKVMLPKDQITFVSETEMLGPLTLDKLYKSGFSHFPVTNKKKQVIGTLHTEALNSLEIRDTDCAKKYLDPHIYYVREDYALEQALSAFLRNNTDFFLVINRQGEITGLLNWSMIISYLFGGIDLTDDFSQDNNKNAVMRR